MKSVFVAIVMVIACACVASAQQAPSSPAPAPPAGPYNDSNCGAWVNDVWVPNANCATYVTVIRHDSVAGTITHVQGHLVTIQQTNRALVVNDQPALDRQQTGKVAAGRQVVAYGYWMNGTFYATSIY